MSQVFAKMIQLGFRNVSALPPPLSHFPLVQLHWDYIREVSKTEEKY